MNALAQVAAHNLTSVREGLKIVRNVVANNPAPTGFTTAELFKLATKETPPADFKPHILPTRPDIVRKKQQPKYPKHQQQKPEPVPPRPDHPIRSMRFLKKEILPILEGNKELETIRTTRIPFNPANVTHATGKRKGKKDASQTSSAAAPAPVTVWVWKTIDPSTLPKPPAPKVIKERFGIEVGVGEDWSHLSKRRMRARFGKVRRDVGTMKLVNKLREEKAKEDTVVKAVN